MHRMTISLDDETAAAIDDHIKRGGYGNRSEAIRDLVRAALAGGSAEIAGRDQCCAAVSYVYDYGARDLATRLDRALHEHHDLAIASMKTSLSHRHCMEVMLLKGRRDAVRRFAQATLAERGVTFGQINLAPIRSDNLRHRHDDGGPPHDHLVPKL